jgi:xylulokinase
MRSRHQKKANPRVRESRPCVLGIDLGTSALKIVALSSSGSVLATARETYPTISSATGQAEQDAELWLTALSKAANRVRSMLRKNAFIEAVALTGQMPTLVALGTSKTIGNAITWQDNRADDWVTRKVDGGLRHDIYLKTGIRIDGRYLAPMFEYHYGAMQRNVKFLFSAKDFLFYALTGSAASDPSTASGYGLFNLRTNSWDPELCQLWGVRVEHLPDVKNSSFSAPLANRGSQLLACAAGIPVFLGCADSVAGAHGISDIEIDLQSIILLTGSSTVILKYDAEARWDDEDRFLVTPLALERTFGREADLLAGGSARGWATDVFRSKGTKSLWRRAYLLAPGADGLFFSPFLAGGEQGVLWNPDLRGTLTGLTLAHDSATIARALLEGMCFEIRRCLEAFEEREPVSSLRLTGWMADVPQQSQLLADILQRPVCAFRLESASAAGAALLSDRIDRQTYLDNIKTEFFRPTRRSSQYAQLYEDYKARFSDSGATLFHY